jgi:hypothetical protein
MHDLAREIDRQLDVRIAGHELEQLAMALVLDDDREQPVLERVAPEDVGAAGGDDGADTPGDERPRRVLA